MARRKTGAVTKLLQDIKPYYSKKEIDKILSVAPATRRKWEGFCLEIIAEFTEYWHPNQPLNFHQSMCLAMISEWKGRNPTIIDLQLVSLIESNAEIMTIETVMRTANQIVSVTSNSNTSEMVKAA